MRLPDVTFKCRVAGEWVNKTTEQFFKGKRVVLFALPGAFTPTCSSKQLPKYEEMYKMFIEKGVTDVYCLSVNDCFVMNAWADSLDIQNVKMIPDGCGTFTRSMGMLVDKPAQGFGMRSWRYAAIINDGLVEEFFEEPGLNNSSIDEDPYTISSPEDVLSFITASEITKSL